MPKIYQLVRWYLFTRGIVHLPGWVSIYRLVNISCSGRSIRFRVMQVLHQMVVPFWQNLCVCSNKRSLNIYTQNIYVRSMAGADCLETIEKEQVAKTLRPICDTRCSTTTWVVKMTIFYFLASTISTAAQWCPKISTTEKNWGYLNAWQKIYPHSGTKVKRTKCQKAQPYTPAKWLCSGCFDCLSKIPKKGHILISKLLLRFWLIVTTVADALSTLHSASKIMTAVWQ